MSITSINAATSELLQAFQPLSDAQIEEKLHLAANVATVFRKISFAERAWAMTNVAQILERDKSSLARLMTLEMGKPIRAAMEEIVKCATTCRYYAGNAEQFLADEVVNVEGTRSYVHYQPLGTVLAVMPWNYPFWQVIRFAAPTIMAGNTALLKHASNVPQCALKLEEIFLEAGFAKGVFQTLLVGSQKVDALLADPRIMAASLTGSAEAGVHVGVSAARHIKKVVLELGGSDPFIVTPSADIEQAVATAVKARIANNGQSCIAAKRFIIADSIAYEFESKFVRSMEELRVGDPLDEATELGPLATAEGVESLDFAVRETVKAGARLLTGGYRLKRPGNFYAPTVLADIPENSPAFHEELFGPVASLFQVKDAREAIRLANSSPYGLGASVWTRDARERERFIEEIEAGMVFVNRMVASDPRLPFGGIKHSGHGRELGVHGIREFTNVKSVVIQGE